MSATIATTKSNPSSTTPAPSDEPIVAARTSTTTVSIPPSSTATADSAPVTANSSGPLNSSVIVGLLVGIGIAFFIIVAGAAIFFKRRRQHDHDRIRDDSRYVPIRACSSTAPLAPVATRYARRVETHEAPPDSAISQIGGSNPVFEMQSPDADKRTTRFIRPNERC